MAEPTPAEVAQRLGIPESFQKHIAADAPHRGKIAVAKGLLPAPPKVLLAMQFVLLGDPDEIVRTESEKALVGIPTARLDGMLDQQSHPKLLEFFVYRRTNDDALMERIALLRQINDKSICYLAETASERIAELVSQNQERLLITPQIVRFLRRNPRLSPAAIDRCVSFLRLYGIDADEATEAERRRSEEAQARADEVAQRAVVEAAAREAAVQRDGPPATPAVVPPPAAAALDPGGFVRGPLPLDFRPGEVYVPPAPSAPFAPPPGLVNPLAALLGDWGIEDRPEFVDAPYPIAVEGDDVAGPPIYGALPATDTSAAVELTARKARSGAVSVDLTGLSSLGASDFAFGFEEDSDDFDAMLVRDADGEADDALRGSIAKALGNLGVGDKIKLAYKGNKSVREALIRDTNKIVACAVVKSGRITDNEVMSIATNRAVHEEVIRELTRVKEYLRKYPVKVALCGNPKTPISVTMGLLNSLHVKDLQQLARNRNVSSAVFSAADKLFRHRRTDRGG